MPSRDAALDALNNRLAAARADPGLLLTDDALRDATELAATTDTSTDLSAAQALGWFHWNRYLSLRDCDGRSDRAVAIRYFIPVCQTSPNSVTAPIQQAIFDHEQDNAKPHADRVGASDRVARHLFRAYQRNGELPALIYAIEAFRLSVAAAPNDHPDRAMYLSDLGTALGALFERTGEIEVLAEAIEVTREAVAAAPNGNPRSAAYLSNLGTGLETLFERTGDIDALTEAIQVWREAVAAAPNGHPDHAKYLNNLGNVLSMLFERAGDIGALAEAIRVTREAVAAAPNDHSDRAAYLNTLGAALGALFEWTGEIDALTEAIQVTREAVAAAPNGHPDRAKYLNNLGNVLSMLFERAGDIGALTEAIEVGRDAVAATPNDHPDHAAYLSNLGAALQALFRRTGDIGALAEAIEVGRDAVAATPDDRPGRVIHLNNLGVALRVLFERTGDIGALTEAIEVGRDALAATPNDHPDHAAYLSNLGAALGALFERTGNIEALTEAIQVTREAVATAPNGHPDRARSLSNLGAALRALFERTESTEALAEAIQTGRDAVAATPNDHPNHAIYLNNLGVALRVLFERTGDIGALTEAIEVGRDALAATPNDHPDHAARLSNLGAILRALFERTGDIEALAEAIEVGRDAVAATPDGHPDHAARLGILGSALEALFERTADNEALAGAVACFRAAGGCPTAAAAVRIRGWLDAAAVLAGGVGESAQDALAAAEAAAELLPQVTPRSLARADREHQLSAIGVLAGLAAAVAIAAGRPERAVELLEQTRGVLVADTVDARSSDLTRLRETDPELAAAFEELRARLDALDQPDGIHRGDLARPDTGQDPEQARREGRNLADARREAQTAWDQLITRIRAVDGFADFLAAPSISKLAVQAQDGPIVFVYTNSTRCDALILTHDLGAPVRLVPLTALTEAVADEQAARLMLARWNAHNPLKEPASRMAAQGEVLEVLAWIWDTITEPVLTALGHTTTPSDEESWPRVWWCPVGFLAYLPLHAAGHHGDLTASDPALKANPRTALDRVISSYTTSARSLAYARAHPGADKGKAVVVAVPDAPNTSPLPGVTAETEALRRFLPNALVLASPTRDAVLAALPDHQVAHFACHGNVNMNDPSSSRLILRDHRTAPLTVADVSALHLNGDLAYLSACDTTVTSPRLADEAVHITGSFHLAGYKHVIGTLWSISDAAAHDITEHFYADLTVDGTTEPQTSRSAHALHHAIRRLRGRYAQAPTLWAAHTHTGT